MTTKEHARILSVGQCLADHGSIARTFEKTFRAQVVAAHTSADALEKLRRDHFALVLVNRVLDSDGSSGLDLIRQLKADETVGKVPVMLVSNYEDAQDQAVAAGAEPGFGKSTMGQPEMLARVERFLKP
jgi:two-component system chemotaxis response regulator CheY